jgi:hypothetical protein
MGLLPGFEPFAVAGTIPGDDLLEFRPVDGAEVVVTRFSVPLQVWIWM